MFLVPDNYFEIKKTRAKGSGLFAQKEIKKGTVIADYLGKVIKTVEYNLDLDKHGLFLMYLTDKASIYPNLKKPGPHLINHSCKPNCWIYVYQGHTLFFAISDIKPGEELTISYLLSPKENTCDNCTHDCKCQNKHCTGTMHLSKIKYKLWQEFQNKQKQKTKTVKFTFGKNLKKLSLYPKTIPLDPIYNQIAS